jgi:nickel-dependent lactate racemase
MRIGISYGREQVELEVNENALLDVHRQDETAPVTDVAAAVRNALEAPVNFPALRRALTPDDHVAVVVDEQLPHLALLVATVLDQLLEAGVQPEAVTLVCQPSGSTQDWLNDLPEHLEGVRVEVHDPSNRKTLSYLATTQKGRRIYLNRTVVDADQVVVLTRLGYDVLQGYGGAAAALYPALSDDETQKEVQGHYSLKAPGTTAWPLRREAEEVVWLLGVPFFVQVIEGHDGELAHVVAGALDSTAAGHQLLDARWRVEVDQRADVVVAGLGGNPHRHGFAEFANALANAARVVKPEGRIILLTDSAPDLGPAAEILRGAGDSAQVLRRLGKERFPGRESAYQWASAADAATVYLLSKLPLEEAEDLLTIPLARAEEAQKLLASGKSLLVLPNAHMVMAVLRNGSRE